MTFASLKTQVAEDTISGRYFVGTVKDTSDDEKLQRVRVTVPGIFDDYSTQELPWASVLRPTFRGAKKDVAVWSIPRKETLVLVIFEKGDINSPIVIGEMTDGQRKVKETTGSKFPAK